MDLYESVRQMQDYIEEHLDEKITLADLSRVSFYSPWYSYRIFTSMLERTPSDYIRRRKLSRSAYDLKNNEVTVTDIALQYGFSSVEGYQRAFYKEFGLNPSEYLKNPIPICMFLPYKKYHKGELSEMKKYEQVTVTVFEKPSRNIIIKRGQNAKHYMEYCEEVGCDIWGILTSMTSKNQEPISMWLTDESGNVTYVQGVEKGIDETLEIPNGFEVITFPKSTYLVFNGEPFEEKDYEQAIKNVWEVMNYYDPSVLGYIWDDSQPRIQLEPIGNRGYIEMRAVKKG